CRDLCVPYSSPCEVTCPQPLANTCNDVCVTSCDDSRAVVYPPPVVLTFPGPVLTSCPQESVVGSCEPLGLARPGSCLGYGGYGSGAGLRGSILFGGSNGYGG
ncbi:Feather keratin 4, partial [Apaloderma vittatum]